MPAVAEPEAATWHLAQVASRRDAGSQQLSPPVWRTPAHRAQTDPFCAAVAGEGGEPNPYLSAVRVHVEVAVCDRLAAIVIGRPRTCPSGGWGRQTELLADAGYRAAPAM